MGEGREPIPGADGLEAVLDRLASATERNADAAEAMFALAKSGLDDMEVEPGPSVCPWCGSFNPVVTVLDDPGQSGPLDHFLIRAETHCCNRVIYAVPQSMVTTPHEAVARELIQQKGGKQE